MREVERARFLPWKRVEPRGGSWEGLGDRRGWRWKREWRGGDDDRSGRVGRNRG